MPIFAYISRTIACLILVLSANHAAAQYLVDTGPGASSGGGTSLYDGQWLALRFPVATADTITGIEGWMNISDGEITISLYSGEGSTPDAGTELYSTPVTVAATASSTPDWRGISGLSWDVAPGNYWVTFEVRSPSVSGSMPSGAAALDIYSFTRSGTWRAGGVPPLGLRISNAPVGGDAPTPSPESAEAVPALPGLWLILTTLGLLAVAFRKHLKLS